MIEKTEAKGPIEEIETIEEEIGVIEEDEEGEAEEEIEEEKEVVVTDSLEVMGREEIEGIEEKRKNMLIKRLENNLRTKKF